jgi:sodium/potassium-transporting ATPase subunit alpha
LLSSFLYIPKLQSVLDTTSVPVAHYFLLMAFGMGILLLDEGRKVDCEEFSEEPLGKD